MKRIFCFIVSIVLFISVFTIPAFADDVALTGSTATCKPGDEVEVSFAISADSGLGAAGFMVKYDSNIFSFVDYEDGPAFKGGMALGNDIGNGIFKFVFIHADGINNGGVMFSIIFKASDSAVKGKKYPFNLEIDNLNAASDTRDLTSNTPTAYVTIADKTTSPVIQTPATPTPSTSKPYSDDSVQSNSSKILSNSDSSNVVSTPTETVSSEMEQKSNDESYYYPILTITSTDTDADSSDFDNTLFIITIVLSVLAVSLIATMVILIIKSYSINKKEK